MLHSVEVLNEEFQSRTAKLKFLADRAHMLELAYFTLKEESHSMMKENFSDSERIRDAAELMNDRMNYRLAELREEIKNVT